MCGGMTMPKTRVKCPRCRHPGVTYSSAVDGRPRMTCKGCGHKWTSGKKAGQGYRDWPTFKGKSNG